MSLSAGAASDRKVYVLSYRDEKFPEPRQLIAYTDAVIAQQIRNQLATTYSELVTSGRPSRFVSVLWTDELRRCGIPEEKFFEIDINRHTNVAFELKGIALSTVNSET